MAVDLGGYHVAAITITKELFTWMVTLFACQTGR